MSENVFEILGMEKRETAYSNFLAYLFILEEKKSGNNRFLEKFLDLVDKNQVASKGSIEVKREEGNEKSEADIIVEGPKYLIVIENKVESGEGEKQTERLYNDWSGFKQDEIFVYLTPGYREGPKCSKFEHITYAEIKNILKELNYSIKDERIRIMINDFNEVLEKYDIVEKRFSQESLEYMRSQPEDPKKKNKFKRDRKYLFKDVKRLLENDEKIASNASWKIKDKGGRIQVYKESWSENTIRIDCKIHDNHIGRGVIVFGVFAYDNGKNRREKYEKFKSYFDDLNKSTKQRWVYEEDDDLYDKIIDGDVEIPQKIKEKMIDYVLKYENAIDDVMK